MRALSLEKLSPPLDLIILDIDSDEASKDDWLKYNLEVPVLMLLVEKNDCIEKITLPRVSPRLNNQGLLLWIQKRLAELVNS